MFSSACIASGKQFLFSREAETLRPLDVRKVEVNSNDLEGAAVAAEDVGEAPELTESENGDEGEAFGQDAGDLRTMMKMTNPKLPSKEDVEAHELNHLPYRNWCPHCVKGRGWKHPTREWREKRELFWKFMLISVFPVVLLGRGNL